MKKTIHINLAGLAFKIEEDAYARLDEYLNAVKFRLGEDEAAGETVEDITLRIAEIFRNTHVDTSFVITMDEVEEVIKTLGNPDDYESAGDPDFSGTDAREWKPPLRKRLYRDPDNRLLAGVCAGLGNYFSVDPILFRLLFILGLFYGISILPYIILWIAIPKAVTLQQRSMMMGGEPGSARWRKASTPGNIRYGDAGNATARTLSVIARVLLMGVTFFSLMVIAVSLSVSDLVFGTLVSEGAWIPEFPSLFLEPLQIDLTMTGIGLILGVPLLMLFYLGLHLVFRFRRAGAAPVVAGLVLWIGGFTLLGYVAVDTLRSFSHRSTVVNEQSLEVPASDTLFINAGSASLTLNKGRFLMHMDNMWLRMNDGELLSLGNPRLRVIEGGDAFKIIIEKRSRGKDETEATANAGKIEYFFLQNDSVLWLDRYFTLQESALIRLQDLHVRVEVPLGKQVVVAPALEPLLN